MNRNGEWRRLGSRRLGVEDADIAVLSVLACLATLSLSQVLLEPWTITVSQSTRQKPTTCEMVQCSHWTRTVAYRSRGWPHQSPGTNEIF
jgi:hypothetical protein